MKLANLNYVETLNQETSMVEGAGCIEICLPKPPCPPMHPVPPVPPCAPVLPCLPEPPKVCIITPVCTPC